MLEQADRFLAFAQQQGETGSIVVGHRLVGTSRLILGRIADANDALHQALLRYVPEEHRMDAGAKQSLRARFGQDLGVTLHCYRSWALWLSGHAAAAEKAAEAALERSEALEHDHQSRFYALWHAGMACVLLRKVDRVAELGTLLTELAKDRELPYWQALGCFLRAWHITRSDRPELAVELVQEGLQLWAQTGSRVFRPICLAFLGEAYGESGKPDFASQHFEEALQIAAETGERWAESEIYRLFGDLHSRYSTADAAVAKYQQAIAVAQGQGAKSFELRASTSLARLLVRQGRNSDAHSLLSSVYTKFDPGCETADLADAKILLQATLTP
jgi:predicted ATPase